MLSRLGGQFAVGNHHGEAIGELLMDEWFCRQLRHQELGKSICMNVHSVLSVIVFMCRSDCLWQLSVWTGNVSHIFH